MNTPKNILKLLSALLVFSSMSCIEIENTYPTLPPGKWRAYLKLDPSVQQLDKQGRPLADVNNLSFKEVTAGELPFTFDLIYDTDSLFHIEIINGKERIIVDDISIGRERATLDDTIRINFPEFDTYIKAKFKEGIMEGHWHVPYKEDYKIPFVAKFGKGYRFTEMTKAPFMDLTGNWGTVFTETKGGEYTGIAEFSQNNNELSGTFRTETGDYRFLAGTIQDKKIYLSAFDGAHAFLFEGRIQEDSTIQGSFRSGSKYQCIWEADRNKEIVLGDENSLTYLKPGYDKMAFEFEGLNGELINLEDDQFKGKKKILQIFGTWCPNCKDETSFLLDYLKNNNTEGLEVIALAFERYDEKEKNLQVLKRYKETMGMDYTILLAGSYKKKEAAKSLPMLNAVIAYPTMIFLNEDNSIEKIHTGFNGPASSKHEAYKKEFYAFMEEFLK